DGRRARIEGTQTSRGREADSTGAGGFARARAGLLLRRDHKSRVPLMTSAKLQCRNSAARRESIMRGRKISKYSMIGATSVSTESSSVISFSFRLTLISEAVAA